MRRDDKTLKMVFHGYLSPDCHEATISDVFGGGHYRAQLTVVTERGEVIKQSRDLDVPGPYKPPTGELPGARALEAAGRSLSPGAQANALPADGGMNILNTALIASVVDLLKSFRDVKTPAAAGITPEVLIAMIQSQSTMQMKMMEAMLTRDKGDSKKEVLDLMEQLKGLISPIGGTSPNPNNPAEIMKNIVETVRQLRDVSDDLNPRGGTEPMDILGKLAEVVVTEQQHRNQGRGQRPPQGRRSVAPAITQGEGKMPVEQVPTWQLVLHKEGPRLLAQAQVGRDPGVVASIAMEYAPPQIAGVLAEFFRQEPADIITKLGEHVPGLKGFPDWTMAFVEEVRLILGYEEDEEESDGSGGDVAEGDSGDKSEGP